MLYAAQVFGVLFGSSVVMQDAVDPICQVFKIAPVIVKAKHLAVKPGCAELCFIGRQEVLPEILAASEEEQILLGRSQDGTFPIDEIQVFGAIQHQVAAVQVSMTEDAGLLYTDGVRLQRMGALQQAEQLVFARQQQAAQRLDARSFGRREAFQPRQAAPQIMLKDQVETFFQNVGQPDLGGAAVQAPHQPCQAHFDTSWQLTKANRFAIDIVEQDHAIAAKPANEPPIPRWQWIGNMRQNAAGMQLIGERQVEIRFAGDRQGVIFRRELEKITPSIRCLHNITGRSPE